MRVPSPYLIGRYMRAAGLLIAGAIIGSAVFMSIYQHNFNLLFLENQRLQTENDELRKTLDPLLKNKNRPSLVSQLKIHLASPMDGKELDEVTATELRRILQNDLEPLRGRTVDAAADSMLVAKRIIERKVYRLSDDQEFTLELQLSVFKGDTLSIWVMASPHVRSG